jgi:GNAT superfamily N-acetyltransferase
MIEVRCVRSRLERRRFLVFPWRIYRDDPLWVPPVLPEHAKRIDPRRGPFFEQGEAELFMAWRDGQPVGRICAAEDRASNRESGQRDCLFGFFETVDDAAVAGALLDRAARWGRDRGLSSLIGPFNLDREDSYGVLVEGRDRPPVLLCGHTPAFYQALIEGCGFRPARADNLAFAIPLQADSPERRKLARLAERIRSKGWVSIRTPDLSQLDKEVDTVHELLNRSLAHLPDHTPWPRSAVEALLKPFARIADPELILFAEVGGKTVGWFPGVPNLNELFMQVNGLRYPWDYLRLLVHARRRPDCLAIKSVLILPEYWGGGVALLLFDELGRRAAAKGYSWADLSLTSADNPFTPSLAQRMGAQLYKRYRVYRRDI